MFWPLFLLLLLAAIVGAADDVVLFVVLLFPCLVLVGSAYFDFQHSTDNHFGRSQLVLFCCCYSVVVAIFLIVVLQLCQQQPRSREHGRCSSRRGDAKGQ